MRSARCRWARADYENFTAQQTYTPGQFADVAADAWYAENVRLAYEYGLINGKTAGSFAPGDPLTVAEAVKLAACLHSIYESGSAAFAPSKPWYRTYADYALETGILTEEPADYGAPATRAVFASLFAAALPAEALEPINEVGDGAIPDVSDGAAYANAVYTLYRAGVLTGSDKAGRYLPDSGIKRSEAAAIVTRMADPALRKTVTLTAWNELTRDEVYDYCMPAVMKLYSYDAKGNLIGMGSGVLIGEDGDAVTCGHLVNGVNRLVAEMTDGSRHEADMYDMDAALDVAHIKLRGEGFPYLQTWEETQAGDTVYALGYPGGGPAKLTAGKVLNLRNEEYGKAMIESDAVVISGNSGGALVDSCGRLIGITVSSQSSGVPSYSMPISALGELDNGSLKSVAEYTQAHLPETETCYAGLYPVPDFGKATGAELLATQRDRSRGVQTVTFYYAAYSLIADWDAAIRRYYTALNKNTFYMFSGSAFTSSAGYSYAVQMYGTTYQGYEAVGIVVTELQSAPIGGLPQAVDFLATGGFQPAYG
ncbi:MAG: trypsin-like peptidase domain-containing protein [Eubacteriales bacterium]|nr:trypsin-like peptidase domain-containing protein [Eubacteriales bacterium]